MEPRVTFDAEAGALVVELADGVVSGTITYPDDAHLVDVDAEGHALSLEILDPGHPLVDQIAARFGFEDQIAAIVGAIAAATAKAVREYTATTWWDIKHVQGTVKVCSASTPSSASASSWAPARELDLTK